MSDGISKALNMTFKMDAVETAKNEIVNIDQQLNALDTKTKTYENNRLVVEDKEYLKLELKDLIASTQEMRRILEDSLRKPPHRSSDIEAYSLVIGQITTLLRELRQLNMDTVNVEMGQRKLETRIANASPSIGTQNNNVFLLDAKELDAMINNAKATSQLKNVVVDFDTDAS